MMENRQTTIEARRLPLLLLLLLLLIPSNDCLSIGAGTSKRTVIPAVKNKQQQRESVASTTASTTDPDTRLLARRIKKCDSSEEALRLLSSLSQLQETKSDDTTRNVNDDAYVAAMRIFGSEQRYDLALHLYNDLCQTEACRTWAISICGKAGQKEEALRLLSAGSTPPTLASYNAAIGACTHTAKDSWQDALRILEEIPLAIARTNKTTTITCNAILTCLAKAKQGEEARRILSLMTMNIDRYPRPDVTSYHRTMNALIWSRNVDGAYQVLHDMMADDNNVTAIDETFDLIANAFGKTGNFTMAQRVERYRQEGLALSGNNDGEPVVERQYYQFQHWETGLTRVGGDKYSYWIVGTFESEGVNLTVALQPNRNPSKNGMKLLFFNDGCEDNEKGGNRKKGDGFLLMINSPAATTADEESSVGASSLLGLYVKPELRDKGLSKIFLAVWMHLCLQANIQPVTGIMNKPLIALVLQHKFGYIPANSNGVDAEISAGKNGAVVLYSRKGTKQLIGAYSPSDLKTGKIVISDEAPTNGRLVRVRAALKPPVERHEFTHRVDGVLGDGFSYTILPKDLQQVLLGY